MDKQKTKKKTKKKQNQDLIRTDVWRLAVTPIQKHQMLLTVDEYRQYLKPLVLIVNAQWVNLALLAAFITGECCGENVSRYSNQL